ncbi:MAG: XisI protein [Thermomicrobiales bacterium]
MESLTQYRRIIRDLIDEYAEEPVSSVGEVRAEVIIDEQQDHYELLFAGWVGPYRVHGSVLHIDIRDGKLWIESDGTEEGIAGRLVAAGIPKDRIVLAFKPPEIRPHTGFAVA